MSLRQSRLAGPFRFRRHRGARHLGVGVGLIVAAGLAGYGVGPGHGTAQAAVQQRAGFTATVLGWTSWYGSYGLGDLGAGWCIDHGLRAPDPVLAYAPTPVTDVSADTRAALSWAATTHSADDPFEAAAVMLALHDLMGARYPFGPLLVERLTPAQVAGFGGREADLIQRARLIRSDALGHRHHRAPFTLRLEVAVDPPTAAARRGHLVATLTDAGGAPVSGAAVTFQADGAHLSDSQSRTGGDGRAQVEMAATGQPAWFLARAAVPDPALSAFASTRAAAQRVARPAWLTVSAAAELAPTTTTSTTTPPVTTTVPPTTRPPKATTTLPPTTATTTPPSTTTVPPTTRPPAATTSTTTTTTPSTSTTPPSTITPPSSPPGSPPVVTTPPPSPPHPVAPSLPITGSETFGLALVGTGLVVSGSALIGLRRFGRARRPASWRAPAPPR